MKSARTKKPPMPVLKRMCKTCPFRVNAKPEHAAVRGVLIERILSTASHICHSTGGNNAFNRTTGNQPALCRGARNLQLKAFASIGFIAAPTDAAWNAKCLEMNLPEIPVINKPIPNKPKSKRTKIK